MSLPVLVMSRVPSSAYHLLVSLRPQEAMSYPLPEAVSHQMSGSTIRSKSRGVVGPPEGSLTGFLPGRCGRVGDKLCGRSTKEVGD